MTTERQFITTRQLAAIRGVSRQAISAAVKRGTIVPALTLENGHFLFDLAEARHDFDPAEWVVA